MIPTQYLSLHLMFERHENKYFVRIAPPAEFLSDYPDAMRELKPTECPFSDLGNLIDVAVAKDVKGLTGGGKTFQCIKQYGKWLDECLRSAEGVYSCLPEALNIHQTGEHLGLLIRLHFSEDAPELAGYLWETWNRRHGNERRFLINLPRVSLVRYVSPVQAKNRSLDRHQSRKLKLLVVTSSFTHDGSRDPRVGEYAQMELASLQPSLGDLFEVVHFADPTYPDLKAALADVDIFHHFGHGAEDPVGGGQMFLSDSHNGKGRAVYWDRLSRCFDPHNAQFLKLAVLNACSLQRMGSHLARLGVPAVIAMQAKIGTEALVDYFTRTLYEQIATGIPLHAAFTEARNSIAGCSDVEPFIPTLTLSTTEEIKFEHPNVEMAIGYADPFKPRWGEAIELETQREFKAALEKLKNLQLDKPDYPGVNDKIEELQRRLSQQQRAVELAEQTKETLDTEDYARLRDIVKEAAPLAGERPLAQALANAFERLGDRLGDLKAQQLWLEARGLCLTLQVLATLLPSVLQPISNCEEVNQQAEQVLAQQRDKLEHLHRYRDYHGLVEQAQAYLQEDPENERVQELLHEGQEIVRLSMRLVIDEEGLPPAAIQYKKLLDSLNAGNWEEASGLVEELMTDVPPAQRNELERHRLYATARQEKDERNWSSVKQHSRTMRRLKPNDPEVLSLLQEALYEEAQELLKHERFDEAEANCRELMELL